MPSRDGAERPEISAYSVVSLGDQPGLCYNRVVLGVLILVGVMLMVFGFYDAITDRRP
jgi:hypothetical protein